MEILCIFMHSFAAIEDTERPGEPGHEEALGCAPKERCPCKQEPQDQQDKGPNDEEQGPPHTEGQWITNNVALPAHPCLECKIFGASSAGSANAIPLQDWEIE